MSAPVSARRRREILDALRRGTVPSNGLDQLAVGLGRFETELDAELNVVAAGGAIHGHPLGPAAGARAFRQAIDAVMAGVPLADAGKADRELGLALELWGIYAEKTAGIFDLKG